jgi:hypothetical protein
MEIGTPRNPLAMSLRAQVVHRRLNEGGAGLNMCGAGLNEGEAGLSAVRVRLG